MSLYKHHRKLSRVFSLSYRARNASSATKPYYTSSYKELSDSDNEESSYYISLLRDCINKGSLEEGQLIHSWILKCSIKLNKYALNSLLNMYCKFGKIEDAGQVFDEMPERDHLSWNSVISGHCKCGMTLEALQLFGQMREHREFWPSEVAFASVMSAVGKVGDLEVGKEIHGEAVREGCDVNLFVGNSIIDMYCKCQSIEDASKVFDKMPTRDLVSWNSMISGFAQNEFMEEALNLFQKMPERNAVSWNAIIAGCAQNGLEDQSLEIFRQMQVIKGLRVSEKTFASVIPACQSLEMGRQIHGKVLGYGFQRNNIVSNALVMMYSNCRSLDDAYKIFSKMTTRDTISWTVMASGFSQNGYFDEAIKLFSEMPERGVFSWTAMIDGYAQNGRGKEALDLFRQMCFSCCEPNTNAVACILPVCAELAALEEGVEIHEYIITRGFASDLRVANGVIHMYAKCGSLQKARNAFDNMFARDIFTWTAMIGGYAMHGCGREALDLFYQMQHCSILPDRVTFVCILSACAHSGLVEEGKMCFHQMTKEFGIHPSIEHYGCLVDCLGRAGHLKEARDVIKMMPIAPTVEVYNCLLGSCCTHNDFEMGESVAKSILRLDPDNSAAHKVLSNIYAITGRWEQKQDLRESMKRKGLVSNPGSSWIYVNGRLCIFNARDEFYMETPSSLVVSGHDKSGKNLENIEVSQHITAL